MKGKSKITSTLLALILSVTMTVTYMPASIIAYATDGNDNGEIVLDTDAGADTDTVDVPDSDSGSQDTEGHDLAPETGSVDEEAEAADTDEPAGIDEEVLQAEDTNELDTPEETTEVTEPKRATKATDTTVLAFTSDVHNQSNNTAANRMDKWIDKVESIHGKIDVYAFGGDMADAGASGTTFLDYAQSDMDVINNHSITGVYTTGNHEYNNNKTYGVVNNATTQQYKINTEAYNGTNCRIYCLGSVSGTSSYSSQISSLTEYLNGAGNDKPIFIITHFPLHYYSSRTTTGASEIIDVLNNAVTNNDQKIVFLWGHNHTMSDTYYDYIYRPGDSIPTSSSSSNKEIKFYYGAAGCMSDGDYGPGSGYVKGKGLVVTINDSKELSFTYYDASGNNVSEGGTFSEITATGITINDVTETGADGQQVVVEKPTIATGKTLQLQVTFEPAGAAGNVTWSSSDESIATVSGSGVVKGISEGTATITATLASSTKRGGTIASIDVTIGPRGPEPTYELTSTLEPGKKYIIANANSGTVHALTNNNGTVASTDVTVEGDTITTDNTDIVFTAEGSGTLVSELVNNDQYLYPHSSSLSFNTSAVNRPWTYNGDTHRLTAKNGNTTYYVRYSSSGSNFTCSSTNQGDIYLFVEQEDGGGGDDPTPIGKTIDITPDASDIPEETIQIDVDETLTINVSNMSTRNAYDFTATLSNSGVAELQSSATVNIAAGGTGRFTVKGVADGAVDITISNNNSSSERKGIIHLTVGEGSSTPAEEDRYEEVNSLEDGKEYILAVTKDDGSVYAINNPGSSPTNTLTLDVNAASGSTPAYIVTNETGVAWKYAASSKYFTNDGDYLYPSSTNGVMTYSSGRAIDYADGKLSFSSSSSGTYYFTCSGGSFNTSKTESDAANIRIFAKTDGSTPVDPPTPGEGDNYKLVDQFTSGKTYLIVSSNSAGGGFALTNPGGTSSGADMGSTSVLIQRGDIDGDSSADIYVTTDKMGIVWIATANDEGFNLTNGSDCLEGKSGKVLIFNSMQYADRYWKYSGSQLQHYGGNNTYTVYYDNGFKSTYNNNTYKLYIYEKIEEEAHTHSYGDPSYEWTADNSTCTATAVCSGCDADTEGHSVTETVAAVYEETTPASCAAAGIGTYTASFASELFTAQTKTVEIPALGHDWDAPVWNWTATDDGYAATATFTCKNDSNHKETKDAEVTKTSGGGQTTYTATVTGPDVNTYTDTKSVVDEEYNLWVNGIRVNSVNKNNIMGSGEASYDPQTMTLTLNNANITEPYTLPNNGAGLIYSDLGSGTTLTIKGTASLIPAGSSSSDGIRMESGNLTFDGKDTNITATVNSNVINAGSSIVTFNNGTVNCETTANYDVCIYGKNIVVNDGKLTASALAIALSGDKIDVNGGEVTAVSTGTSGGSYGFNSKEININGGAVNVSAKSGDLYAYNAGSINIIGGIVNLNGSNVGIYGSNSSLTISGGTVTSASSINVDHDASISGGTVHLTGDSARIYVKRNLTISGENTVVELDKGTIETLDGLITIEDPLGIVLPTNYVISSNGKKLVDEETGRAEATHILISKPILLTVTFNNQGHGVKPADKTNVRYGTTIESPGDLEEEGWVFGGWYKEAACTNLFDFTAPITENTTIFAKWTRVTTYPISFVDEDGVTVLETQNVASGATPVYGGTTPAKAADVDYRYEFAGWTPEITAVTGPATYTAVYTKIARTYGEPVWAWAEDRKSATATFTTNDGAEAFSRTATDNAPAKSVVPATCEEAGKTVYTATVTFKEKTYTNTQEDVIPATGHDYGVPTYVWADDYSTVTATRVCANDSSHIETETADATYEVTTPATETNAGVGKWTSAAFENEAFAVQTMDVEIPPTGYDVSYVWNKTDDGYTVTGTAVPFDTSAQTITETVDATYAVTTLATCTAPGEGTWTSAAFTKSQFAVQTNKEPIEALGHDLAATAAKAATCDEAGNSAYWTCSRCGKFFSGEEGETEIAKDSWIIPALGHAWNEPTYEWAEDNSTATATRTCKHDASHTETETATVASSITKQPTCEAKGETTYTATFTNTAFVAQTKTEANIPALGHDWDDPTYEWAADNSTVTATRTCKNDPAHVETETVNTSSEVTKPATCEAKGETTYTATFTNTAFETQTKVVANIPTLGHDWGTPTYTWAADNSKVTATRVCKNDPSHVETETVNTTSEVTKPATCEAKGETTYTATFTNPAFQAQTKTEADIEALGHDWDTANIEWTWSTDNSSATATFTCKNDANHKNVLTAEVTSTTTAATCEEAGETRYKAEVTLEDRIYSDTKTVVIPALGHDWGTPTYEWAADNSKVTATRTCKNDPAHVETETVQATYAVTTPASCTTDGEGTWTSASFTNTAFAVQTKTETIAATGHDWNDPTYEWAADNSKVTATRTCQNDSSHVETETVGATYEEVSPATDTEAGSGKWTSAAFENEAFEAQTMTVILPPTGYSVTYEWTKTADGYTVTGTAVPYNTAAETITETVDATYEVTTPATCEAEGVGTWTSEAFESSQFGVQTKTEAIGVLGHDPVKTDAVAATCEAAGNNAYWTCSRCGKFFSDAEGKTEISEGSWIIPATGHDWGEPTYTWTADNSKVTATRTCGNDADHVQTETVNTTSEVTKAATCETKGETTYTSAAFENEAFAVQTKTVANIDATGHNWNEPTYTWAADNSAVTATRTCKNYPAHVETETAETTSEVTKPATCEAKGETTYTATFTNSAFAVQSKTLENVEPIGHDWNAPTYTWAADNSAVTATRTCKHDASHKQTETVDATGEVTKEPTCVEEGEKVFTSEDFTNEAFAAQTKTVVLDATGHSFRQTNAKPATCTENGNITYYTCTKCGKHFSYEDGTTELVDNEWVIPKFGHDWDEPVYEWAADNSRVTATRICKNDEKHIESETVNAVKVTTPATCEADGVTTYTATFTNEAFETQTRTITIDAIGHSWNAPTYTWAADNSTVTATRTCANDPAHVETETADATYEVTTPATETNAGEGKWTSAAFKNKAFAVQTKTVEIPPTGFNVSYEWTKTEDGYKVTGTAVPLDTSAETITETVDATYAVTTPATCTAPGEGTWTSAAFENSQFAVQTQTQEIGVLGHDPIMTEAHAATCEEPGNTAYWTCSRCGKFFSDAEGKAEISDGDWVTPATGHDWTAPTYTWADDNSAVTATRTCNNDPAHVETETVKTTSAVSTEPTCEEKGETTYTASFTNNAFAVQTRTIANIDATGHDWNIENILWTWADEFGSATAKFTCKNDGSHNETVKATVTSATTNPSCETAGKTVYTAVVTFNGADYSDVMTEEIPATGHDWNAPTYEWAEDNSTVTATRTCKNDQAHVETETVNTTSSVTKPATCEAKGETTYTATFANTAFAVQTKVVEDVDMTGHDWNAPTYVWAADNSTVTATRICKNDATHVETETVNATSEVTKQATCTEAGETTYTATFENKAFAKQTKTETNIDALGHDWSEWKVTKPATVTAEGVETRECSRCDETESRDIAKLEPETPGSDPNETASDGTKVGPGASEACAEQAIKNMASDTDPKGASFSKLQLRSPKQTAKSIKLKWTKVPNAKKYVIYGNKCGKTTKPQRIATITNINQTTKTFTNVAGKKVVKGTYYKFIIVALDKNNKVVSTSKLIHVATKSNKIGNHKSVKVSKAVIKKAAKLKKGKTLKLKAKAVQQSKKLKVRKHVGIRYESTNPKIATVSKSGVIKAKAAGKCYVYAYAQNGVFKKIKVVVKK